jgi:tricorn protease
VVVQIEGDFPEIRPHAVSVSNALRDARLSPTGDRVAFVARGEILVVDIRTGQASNLTRSPGTMERDPNWAPDGKRIAYLSDESGEYALHVRSAEGGGPTETFGLGTPPSFYYAPRWSPDGAALAYIDKHQNIWFVDVRAKRSVKVDAEAYFDYFQTFTPVVNLAPVWSPDGRWLAYAKHLRNGFGAIFLYSLETGRNTPVTDDSCNAMHPTFDPDGKTLYFTAQTSSTPAGKGRAYAVRLRDDRSTLRAGELNEGGREQGPPAKTRILIDLEGISRRVRPLPVPPGNYAGLTGATRGVLFLIDASGSSAFDQPRLTVHRLDLKAEKTTRYLTSISSVDISADGQTMLYQKEGRWAACPTASSPPSGEALIPTEALTLWVEPRAAWRQMFQEVLRLERDFFYDPNLYGVDLKAMDARYRPYLEGLVTRADVNVLFSQMLGELSVSHVKIYGGDLSEQPARPRAGLLGADYVIEGGRYRFARVYTGDRLDPAVNAPLAQPGVQVDVGEYLLAVDGQSLTAGSDNVYRAFDGKVGKPTVIRVGAEPDGDAARDLTVRAIADELGLRQWAWIEENRRRVSEATEGRVGYVYVPHTLGFEGVNYALSVQKDKEAVILDERFALGGDLPVTLMERLSFPLISLGSGRQSSSPVNPHRIMTPKVLLINEYAGSGSDALAWFFRRLGLGPIVGKRTRGELTGAFGTPELMDGGVLEIPSVVIWGTKGEWVENRGIAPDIDVAFDPEQARRGYDPQLEAAIKVALDELQKSPAKLPRRPAYPNYGTGQE